MNANHLKDISGYSASMRACMERVANCHVCSAPRDWPVLVTTLLYKISVHNNTGVEALSIV